MPQNAQLSAVTGANILILSDHASNVNRMMRIIARIDQVGNSDIDVIPLQSATAADTARVLTTLLAQTGEAASGVKIVADDRSNSILVSGDPALRLQLKTLVTHLDTPVDTGSDDAGALPAISPTPRISRRGSRSRCRANSGRAARAPMASSSSAIRAQPQPNAQGNTAQPEQPADLGHAGGGAPPSRSPAATPRSGPTRTPMRSSSPPASARMRALNAVIDKLDIRRAQVLVQAIIAEVTVDKTADLGINWAVDGTNTSVGVGGFISPVGGTSIVDLFKDSQTRPRDHSDLDAHPPDRHHDRHRPAQASGVNFAVMLRALQGDTRTNIIAHPSVVTRDNQEAKMEVAQEVPFLTGQYSHHQRHRQRIPDHPARGCRHPPDGDARPSTKATRCC